MNKSLRQMAIIAGMSSLSYAIVFFPIPSTLMAMEVQKCQIETARHAVGTIEEAVALISGFYGTTGVAVAFDADDTLVSKKTTLQNGAVLRYLEKSTWIDLSIHGGVHPIFQTVNDDLGLNLVATRRSFKDIRRKIAGDAERSGKASPLSDLSQSYYYVENRYGQPATRGPIETLKTGGALVCVASAAAGEESQPKKEFISQLGFSTGHFIRGARKLEGVINLLNERGSQDISITTPIHTIILIDDTDSYVDAWLKSAAKLGTEREKDLKLTASFEKHPFIKSVSDTSKIKIVGIDYKYFEQPNHQKMIAAHMMSEFYELYGPDYKNNPLMQEFLDSDALKLEEVKFSEIPFGESDLEESVNREENCVIS